MNNGVNSFITATNFERSSHIKGPTLNTPNIRNKETNARQFGAKQLKIILKTSQRLTIHVHFWEAYRPFMHLRSSKQASDIMLIETMWL